MKNLLLVPVLLLAFGATATPSITDGAAKEIVLTIEDSPEPIPQVSGVTVVSITDGADPVGVSDVSFDQEGTSICIRAVVDDKAASGVLVVVLSFESGDSVGLVIDLDAITDGADPV